MNRKRIGVLIPAAVILAVFAAAITVGAMLNNEHNPGAKVAEAAGRVDRQVDDTQAAFTDIKELIPDNRSFERQALQRPENSGNAGGTNTGHVSKTSADTSASVNAGVENNDGSDAPVDLSRGINPASGSAPASGSIEESDDGDDGGEPKQPPPTLTFNQQAREVQGDRALTLYQEAMDRIVDNWTPQYEAARREHDELVIRIDDARDLWPLYRDEQIALIEKQGNSRLRTIMEESLREDTVAYRRWHQKAQDVELRSAEALSKIEDMNHFIVFYKNQSDFRAITDYDDFDVPLQVGLLLESLDAFEAETTGLAEAMSTK